MALWRNGADAHERRPNSNCRSSAREGNRFRSQLPQRTNSPLAHPPQGFVSCRSKCEKPSWAFLSGL